MWPLVVVVAYEAPVPFEQAGLDLVRLVERFNFAYRRRPALAGGDILYSNFFTVARKL
jgi:hypothetical protein